MDSTSLYTSVVRAALPGRGIPRKPNGLARGPYTSVVSTVRGKEEVIRRDMP